MDDQTLSDLRAIRAYVHELETSDSYRMISVRRAAEDLGFAERIDAILAACVEGGFNYCLDHTVPINSYHGEALDKPEYPSWEVCYWGADQLRSRLDCVDYRIYR